MIKTGNVTRLQLSLVTQYGVRHHRRIHSQARHEGECTLTHDGSSGPMKAAAAVDIFNTVNNSFPQLLQFVSPGMKLMLQGGTAYSIFSISISHNDNYVIVQPAVCEPFFYLLQLLY